MGWGADSYGGKLRPNISAHVGMLCMLVATCCRFINSHSASTRVGVNICMKHANVSRSHYVGMIQASTSEITSSSMNTSSLKKADKLTHEVKAK